MKKIIFISLGLIWQSLFMWSQPTWQVLTTNTTKDLSTVQCFQQDTLFIFGDDGKLLYSSNGGSSFTTILFNTSGAFTGYFRTIDTGFITSGGGMIFRTDNGGTNWLPTSGSCTCMVTSICFANSQVGLYGGLTGLFKSIDGGHSWSTTPLAYSAAPNKIVSLNDSNFMYAYHKVFHRSSDAGNSFTHDTLNYSSGYSLLGLNFINDSVGFVASADGILFKTTNQGIHWDSIGHIGLMVRDIVFTDDKQGYAIVTNQYNTIAKTIDGGLHWYQDFVATNLIERLDYDGHALYAVGQGGLALKKLIYPTTLPDTSKEAIQLYPNPAMDEIFLSGIQEKTYVYLYQSDGQLLRTVETMKACSLNISSLSYGLYFLRLHSASDISSFRFTKR